MGGASRARSASSEVQKAAVMTPRPACSRAFRFRSLGRDGPHGADGALRPLARFFLDPGRWQNQGRQLEAILVATDFSESAEGAIDWAVEVARRRRGPGQYDSRGRRVDRRRPDRHRDARADGLEAGLPRQHRRPRRAPGHLPGADRPSGARSPAPPDPAHPRPDGLLGGRRASAARVGAVARPRERERARGGSARVPAASPHRLSLDAAPDPSPERPGARGAAPPREDRGSPARARLRRPGRRAGRPSGPAAGGRSGGRRSAPSSRSTSIEWSARGVCAPAGPPGGSGVATETRTRRTTSACASRLTASSCATGYPSPTGRGTRSLRRCRSSASRAGSAAAARTCAALRRQDPRAARRRARRGPLVPGATEGHVAKDVRPTVPGCARSRRDGPPGHGRERGAISRFVVPYRPASGDRPPNGTGSNGSPRDFSSRLTASEVACCHQVSWLVTSEGEAATAPVVRRMPLEDIAARSHRAGFVP